MDRRKTLGALSPGSLNARASLAPGRYAKDGAKAAGWGGKVPLDKAMGRLSLAGPVQRRSSAYTTVKGSGLKSDPRPISDKQFQANCARTIITYLATHNYEYQINPKVCGFCGGVICVWMWSDFSEGLGGGRFPH